MIGKNLEDADVYFWSHSNIVVLMGAPATCTKRKPSSEMRSWDSWILGFLAAVVLVQASGAGEGGAKHGAKAPRSAPGSVKALVYQDLAAGRTAHRPEQPRPLPSFLCQPIFAVAGCPG